MRLSWPRVRGQGADCGLRWEGQPGLREGDLDPELGGARLGSSLLGPVCCAPPGQVPPTLSGGPAAV